MRSGGARKWRVIAGTAAVVGAYATGTWFVNSLLRTVPQLTSSLRWPLAIFLVQLAVVVMMTAGICFVKMKQRLRDRSAATRQDAIQRMVAAHATGESSRIRLDPEWMKHPEELARHLETMLLTTKGAARHRLSRLVSEIGLTAHWMRESAASSSDRRRTAVRRLGLVEGYTIPDRLSSMISDPDPAVRIAVYRALLKTGEDEDVDRVFVAVTGESLLIRALLNSELGKNATGLSLRVLPDALRTADPKRLTLLLDMIVAWRRAVTVTGLRELLQSLDMGVRKRVISLLPYLTDEQEAEAQIQMQLVKLEAVLAGLEKGDEGVMAAAAATSGRLFMESAIPLLARGLKDRRYCVARSFAEALAEFGHLGVGVLEGEILTSRGAGASVALEALEHAQSGQLARGPK
jgi:HEAT repeat protein